LTFSLVYDIIVVPKEIKTMNEMMVLEQLMIDNKDVLIRLKEGNPEDYTIEAIKEREKK
jgi:hypothetical protein